MPINRMDEKLVVIFTNRILYGNRNKYTTWVNLPNMWSERNKTQTST